MKIALVHDYLIQYGGAERVLEVLCEMFPNAPIYTLFYDREKIKGKFADHKIITSFLDTPFVRRHYKWFFLLMPLAAFTLKVDSQYRQIICCSSSFAKGIRLPLCTKKILYCYTPIRYAWDNNVLDDGLKSLGMPKVMRFLGSLIWWMLQTLLQKWDCYFSKKFDVILSVSDFIAQKIEKYYNREAKVLYPPVDLNKFYYDSSIKREKFFLMAGRLVAYKKFDLVIRVFNELRLPLKIVGIGPEGKRLRLLAQSPLIEFVDRVSDEELRKYYSRARAFIFPQEEDFGIVAVEAMACGAPVIAYGSGGILEIAKPNLNGIFFDQQNLTSLTTAIEQFVDLKWDHDAISQSVANFSVENFKKELLNLL